MSANGRIKILCDHKGEGSWLCWLCHSRHWACQDVCPHDDGVNGRWQEEQDPPVLLTESTNFRSKERR